MPCGGVQGQSSGVHVCEGCSWVIALDVLWSTVCPCGWILPSFAFLSRSQEEEEEARSPVVLPVYWLSLDLVSVSQTALVTKSHNEAM